MAFGTPTSYAASGPGRAWQGCATDGTLESTQSAVYTGTDGASLSASAIDHAYTALYEA